MAKPSKVIVSVIISIVLSLITYLSCYFFAESFYFDKIFYQKSISHGYIPEYKVLDEKSYGDRTTDLIELDHQPTFSNTQDKFIVLIIGDSYTWGEGVRNNQRFSYLLEKKLNKIKPTRVITIAKPGWNSTEYAAAYQKAINKVDPNLTIFALVHNDVFVYKDNINDPVYQQCQQEYPQTKPIMDIDLVSMLNNHTSPEEIQKSFDNNQRIVWENPLNICILNKNFATLPIHKSIYFTTDDYGGNEMYTNYIKQVQSQGKQVLTSSQASKLPKYKYLWNNNNPYPHLTISTKEAHPNPLAHKIYADVLFQEITSNHSWNFN